MDLEATMARLSGQGSANGSGLGSENYSGLVVERGLAQEPGLTMVLPLVLVVERGLAQAPGPTMVLPLVMRKGRYSEGGQIRSASQGAENFVLHRTPLNNTCNPFPGPYLKWRTTHGLQKFVESTHALQRR